MLFSVVVSSSSNADGSWSMYVKRGEGSGNCTNIPHAAHPEKGLPQLILPPVNASVQPSWLESLRTWRTDCSSWLQLDDSYFEMEALRWTASAYVTGQCICVDGGFTGMGP